MTRTNETKTCPWCEGRKVVGRLAFGDTPRSVDVAGVAVPVIATMLDQPCGVCKGTGVVPIDWQWGDQKSST